SGSGQPPFASRRSRTAGPTASRTVATRWTPSSSATFTFIVRQPDARASRAASSGGTRGIIAFTSTTSRTGAGNAWAADSSPARSEPHRQGPLPGAGVRGDVAEVVRHQDGHRQQADGDAAPPGGGGYGSALDVGGADGGHHAEEDEHGDLAQAPRRVRPRPAR